MENRALDKLFQDGLSAQEIESTTVFTGEERQWNVVRNRLASKMKYINGLRVVAVLGVISLVSVYVLLGLSPKANVAGSGNATKNLSSTQNSQENNTISPILTEESDYSDNSNNSEDLSKSQKQQKHIETILTSNDQDGFPAKNSTTKSGNANVITKLTYENSRYTSNQNEITDESQLAYGNEVINTNSDSNPIQNTYSVQNNYSSSEINNQSNIVVNKPAREKLFESCLSNTFLQPFPYEERNLMNSWDKEMSPGIFTYASDQKFVSFHVGLEYPIHFLHAVLDNSGFAYTGGINVKIHAKWLVSMDYSYQNINRKTSESPEFFNLPYQSEAYTDTEPVSTNIEYTSHAFRPNIYYQLLDSDRWNVLGGIGVELVNRSSALANFTYEGAYQPETETFNFEQEFIASSNVSTSLMLNYRLFNTVYLTSRYRYLANFGNGINWKLKNRVFIGLSYKI